MLTDGRFFFVDWATFTFSLSNVILMGWLGLTILLNTERRVWGAWLAGLGLLLGSGFFVSHTAILAFGVDYSSSGLNFWWQAGLVPVVALPFIWYVLILWYAGFWEDREASLTRRQFWPFRSVLFTAITLLGLLLIANPARSFTQAVTLSLQSVPSLFGLPILVLLYPLYSLACIGLSLDALRSPGPSDRLLGDAARQRARPWLIATSVSLLVVSLLVASVLIYIFTNLEHIQNLFSQALLISIFDVAISGLILLAAAFIGEAITHYEIFTGKALPRRGLTEQWRRALALALIFSATVSGAFILGVRTIYILLGAIVMMTAFFSLLNWRTTDERRQYIAQLRPFVTQENLLDPLRDMQQVNADIQTAFVSLAREILGARSAALLPAGPLEALVGPPLSYPVDLDVAQNDYAGLLDAFESPAPTARALPAEMDGQSMFTIPLWNARGKTGLLLLGPKTDGGVYTQEEIEIAQSSAERLLDARASAAIAAQLMNLQRERLAETQVLDQRTRRVLHDEVLQQLHTAMIQLDAEADSSTKAAVMQSLTETHKRISDLLREMPGTALPIIGETGLVESLRQLIREEFSNQFDALNWEVPETDTIPELPKLHAEVTYYAAREALRNAARHARKPGQPLRLIIRIDPDARQIMIEDDGTGVISLPTSGQGGGQGLTLHSTMMAVIGGELIVESEAGTYTRVTLQLPAEH